MKIVEKSYNVSAPEYLEYSHHKHILEDFKERLLKNGVKRTDYKDLDFDIWNDKSPEEIKAMLNKQSNVIKGDFNPKEEWWKPKKAEGGIARVGYAGGGLKWLLSLGKKKKPKIKRPGRHSKRPNKNSRKKKKRGSGK